MFFYPELVEKGNRERRLCANPSIGETPPLFHFLFSPSTNDMKKKKKGAVNIPEGEEEGEKGPKRLTL